MSVIISSACKVSVDIILIMIVITFFSIKTIYKETLSNARDAKGNIHYVSLIKVWLFIITFLSSSVLSLFIIAPHILK
jgi:heme/copper-type cytochrome/quinol oxidase subunit 2